MEPDIKIRVEKDFGSTADKAIAMIQQFEKNQGLNPRVTRCIIHLSDGDITKLKSNIDAANQDWRDIIYWAEGDNAFVFNEPFMNS